MNARPLPTAIAAGTCLLSASALTRLFDGFLWWFGPVLAATAVAVGTAVMSRLLRLPPVAGILLSLAGLVCAVTALCARHTALLGVLPTTGSVETLRGLVSAGSSDISRLAAPVPDRPGLAVLTVIGIYLVTMIVDLVVVTLDRPTLGGLPLLALYAVSAAILPGGVGTVPFLLGAVSFIALLLLEGRLAFGRWGRAVSDGRRGGSDVFGGRIAANALGVAVVALVVAVTVPMAVPSLDGRGLVSRKGGYGAGDGPSSASVVQPIVSVSQQLHAATEVPLLRVRFNQPTYLRLTALENFDGQLFTLRALNATRQDRISEGLPKPHLGGTTETVSADVTVSSRFDELYLPVPGSPTRIKGLAGDWRLANPTGTIFSTRTSTANAQYHVDAVVTDPTRAQLEAATGPIPPALDVATGLPTNLDPRIRQLVADVTAHARTPYDKVYAIQEHLRGPLFTYDLNGAPTTQEGALSQFLFDTHTGYCEQFASAMTVMVRALGLPARVAIGFVPGPRQADGSYLVTNRQAHAWPEVWFPTIGWVPFEPTRRNDGATTAPSYAPAGADDPDGAAAPTGTASQSGTQTVPEPVPVPQASVPATPTAPATVTAPKVSDDQPSAHSGMPAWVIWMCSVVPTVGLLAIPAIIRIRRRRGRLRRARTGSAGPPDAGDKRDSRSGADLSGEGALRQVHDAWAELLDVAADLGIAIRPSDSPRSGVARLTAYLDAEPPPAAPARPTEAAGPAGYVTSPPDGAGPAGAEPPVAFLEARAALTRLAHAEERARYAPPGMAVAPSVHDVTEDIILASGTLWAVAPRTRRVLAWIAPPSVFRHGEHSERGEAPSPWERLRGDRRGGGVGRPATAEHNDPEQRAPDGEEPEHGSRERGLPDQGAEDGRRTGDHRRTTTSAGR